ncbi:6f7f163c-d1e3-4857-b63c-3443b4d150d7-CDS [Sclerotinia trifoliorum]|uniref:6f7f163c-d1e3-4857-b63c-3443b4d150d7-CDS n=1 Tax=Sclerotinia trifoliorum TaxID=28548 RepID=A0A8H2VSM9_9HELO|nr:6f7f163c-d1e3-4857-b63c-3443b4d150d7-CDS [Sclerotinia trifoliorum]
MPPRIPRARAGWAKSFGTPSNLEKAHICPICSLSQYSQRSRSQPRQSKLLPGSRSQVRQSSSAPVHSIHNDEIRKISKIDRNALREALLEVQRYATNYVNISRLQLALRGLEQPEGQETIRVAILGLADGGTSLKKAKELLRLILADPLKAEEEWERGIMRCDGMGRPLLIRVGHNEDESSERNGRLVHEMNISSPMFNGHKMEILVLEIDPPTNVEQGFFEEAVLVPTMEIPTSSTGRYTPVTTPVHKSFLLGHGIMGAASLLSYPLGANREAIGSAANFRTAESQSLPIPSIDIESGNEALHTFRESIENAMIYEHQWLSSGIPEVIDWMKLDASSNNNTIKEPLLRLISSIIQNAEKKLEAEKARQLSLLLSTKIPPTQISSLRHALSTWSERAHTELRDQLDIAFGGQRWRKLGWWKLFWRVDDVSMITSDMLSRSFLTEAEKEIIFLAGRTEEAGVYRNIPLLSDSIQKSDWAYTPVQEALPEGLPPPPKLRDVIPIAADEDTSRKIIPQPWPLHIPIARAFLSTTTIPALQALAQRLVLQTLSTSSMTSALAGLMYVSNMSTTIYEAGAVAAFGIVWSMRRMQKKWETARAYWEGEVREEGRKAVRNVETIVGENLNKAEKGKGSDPAIERDLEKAREVIRSAEDIIR